MTRISERYFDLNSTDERSVKENWKFLHEQHLRLMEETVPKKTLSTISHLPCYFKTTTQEKTINITMMLRNTSIKKIGMNTKG